MAASFHQGFSDHPAEFDVEIGHYLGLRWFHLTSGPDPQWRPSGPAATAIRTRRREVWQQLKELADETANTMRRFSDAEQARWDRGTALLDGLDNALASGRPQVLRLTGARGAWHKGENVARCLTYADPHFSHVVPVENCGCGFWAYWALGDKQVSSPAVAGIVKGYGEVIEGELGFRCSHAKIVALFPLGYSTELALNLEDAYGADVYHNFQAMLEMNRAPAGQPPLTDAYFSRTKLFAAPVPAPAVARNVAGISFAFKRGLLPCTKCGNIACAPGQGLCLPCDIAEITGLTA
jgi:hypothetical protein